MFQGSATSENRNRIPTAAQVAQLDAVVLTHAHLDHTGRLPLLAKLELPGLFDVLEDRPAPVAA
jgi:metallo-beta-lactamase family protein